MTLHSYHHVSANQSFNRWESSRTVKGIALPREERKYVGNLENSEDTVCQSQRPSDDWWTGSMYKGKDYSFPGNEAAVTNFTPTHKTDDLHKMHRSGGNITSTWSYNSEGSEHDKLRLNLGKGIASLSCH